MSNQKATGVAYADPQFDSVSVTGAIGMWGKTLATSQAAALTTYTIAAMTTTDIPSMTTTQVAALNSNIANIAPIINALKGVGILA